MRVIPDRVAFTKSGSEKMESLDFRLDEDEDGSFQELGHRLPDHELLLLSPILGGPADAEDVSESTTKQLTRQRSEEDVSRI